MIMYAWQHARVYVYITHLFEGFPSSKNRVVVGEFTSHAKGNSVGYIDHAKHRDFGGKAVIYDTMCLSCSRTSSHLVSITPSKESLAYATLRLGPEVNFIKSCDRA